MDTNKLDWIVSIVRSLKEEGGMVVGNGGFTNAADPKGPVAGFDPVLGSVRRKKVIGLGKGSRNRWNPKKQSS